MTLFDFKCRAIEISHSCAHGNEQEPQHPSLLLNRIKDIERTLKIIPFTGTIKSATNSYQIDFDFDDCWIKSMKILGWDSKPLDKLHNLKDIPNIKPDGILTKDKISITLEIEKSNKKTIWFDYMKLMLIIGKGIADFGLLITPRNYAHKVGVWNLFNEARYYRYCLSQFAKVDEELLSKIAIIGYTQEVYVSDKWNTLDSSLIKSIKEQAKKFF